MKLTYKDIRHRIYTANSPVRSVSSMQPRLYTESGLFCTNNAVEAIANWRSLGETSNQAFDKALDIFNELCINANESTIRTSGQILIENIDKVRDAGALARSIKYHTTRLTTKSVTKIQNKLNDVQKAITGIKPAASDALDKLNSALPDTPKPAEPVKTQDPVTQEIYNAMQDEAAKCIEIDRIIENYNLISNRFNLDRLVSEISSEQDNRDTVMQISEYMDTYDIPFKLKYCMALENSFYVFNKNHMSYPNERIVEDVTDYFIFSSGLSEQGLADIRRVRDISVVFEEKDFGPLNYILDDKSLDNEEPEPQRGDDAVMAEHAVEDSALVESMVAGYTADILNEDNVLHVAKQVASNLKNSFLQGNPDEDVSAETRKMISDFRKQVAKDPNNTANMPKLKAIITKFFSSSPKNIINGTKSIFSIIRGLVIFTGVAINPVASLVTLAADLVIKNTVDKKQAEKYLNAYKDEYESIQAKIEKTKDAEKKARLEKYAEELKKDYAKLKKFENNLYSDDENFERDTDEHLDKKDVPQDDDDFGFDVDFDFDDDDDEDDEDDDEELKEMAAVVYCSNMISSISEALLDTDLDGIVYNNIFKLDPDALNALTSFAVTVPVVLEKDSLKEAMLNYRDQLRTVESKTVEEYIKIDTLNECARKIENSPKCYNSYSIEQQAYYLSCIDEIVKLNADTSYISEMQFTNTIKLAIDRLKRKAIGLSEKEKKMSNSLDASLNNLAANMDKAKVKENREMIMRGSILPPASKCIKLAIELGVAWAINPAIAVIDALGRFVSHKASSKRERQLVLDDLEVELKMCERYIHQAEEENDLKKVREYELLKRSISRQIQKIKYNMRVYNQVVPGANVGTTRGD